MWFSLRHTECLVSLTLSLPECLTEFCKVTLTLEYVDEILWCDHSNENSLPVLSHDAICLSKFEKMKFGNLVGICLWPHLAVKRLSSASGPVLRRRNPSAPYGKTLVRIMLQTIKIRSKTTVLCSNILNDQKLNNFIQSKVQQLG